MADQYRPDPSYKRKRAPGPPPWQPDLEACPPMDVEEREALFEAALPLNPEDPRSVRYALRRTPEGHLEFFSAEFSCERGRTDIYSGHPVREVPPQVLMQWREMNRLSEAEYEYLRDRFGR
jgi:hypothetical protein